MNKAVVLIPQLPRTQLNSHEFKRHLADTETVAALRINGVKLINHKPIKKPRAADVVLSCKVLSDIERMPLYELTNKGEIISNSSPLIDHSQVLKGNANGLNVNLIFPVNMGVIPMGQPGIFVDNTMEFYDILNSILQNKQMISSNNECEIRLNVKAMKEVLPGSIFRIKAVYSDEGLYIKLVGGRNGDME